MVRKNSIVSSSELKGLLEGDQDVLKELALVENLVREDLTAIETAEAFERLRHNLGDKPQTDLAKLTGKAESTISEILSLNKLPQDIRDEIRGDKRYSVRELRKIASKRNVENQRALFKKYKNKLDGKNARVKTGGFALYRKKINDMQTFFTSINEKYKPSELTSLKNELIELKSNIDLILNNIGILDTQFGAPKGLKLTNDVDEQSKSAKHRPLWDDLEDIP